jgi:hypothetical protein
MLRYLRCCIGLDEKTKEWAEDKKTKTYNRRDSQMVTHSSTSRPVQCLCIAERTGYNSRNRAFQEMAAPHLASWCSDGHYSAAQHTGQGSANASGSEKTLRLDGGVPRTYQLACLKAEHFSEPFHPRRIAG